MEVKKTLKIILLFPVIITWDAFFYLMTKIYNTCVYIDEHGGNIIERYIKGD